MGLLGLPHAMAHVGWAIGLSSCVIFGLFAFYSALLLGRVKNECLGHAESYGDVAHYVFGPRFASFTRTAVHLTWATVLPFFLLACAESAATLFGMVTASTTLWTLLVAVLLLGPLQMRTLHQVSWLSFASSIAVIVAVGLIILALLMQPAGHAHNVHVSASGGLHVQVHTDDGVMAFAAASNGSSAHSPHPLPRQLASAAKAAAATHTHSMWLPPDVAPLDIYGHISSFVFAYSGHSVRHALSIAGPLASCAPSRVPHTHT